MEEVRFRNDIAIPKDSLGIQKISPRTMTFADCLFLEM
jgi:hypothetical protein